ncbi:MAG TPA: SpoVR family protein, partial [Deltaproteobacteria bacterium]|nr:SpoVR family protein [Deltaproteobacteria bacterium]
WLDCDDVVVKRDWNTEAGLGRQKIFDVRRTHNDVTFIDEFLTEDFVREQGLFTYEYDKRAGHYKVDSREFRAVKQKLLSMLSNRGNPRIFVTDGNHANRGELELTHEHEGSDMQLQWAEQTLRNVAHLWGRPVHLVTQVDDVRVVLHHDGTEFKADGLKKRRRTKR